MDRIGRRTDNCASREVVSRNHDTMFGRYTRKSHTHCAVQSQSFVDARLQIGEFLDLFGCSDVRFKEFVELFVELVLYVRRAR